MYIAKDNGQVIQALRPSTTQSVSISGTSAACTNAFGSKTVIVRVMSTTDCYITFGTSPTATTSHAPLPAYAVEYFAVKGGEKIAGIQMSTSGTLYVTEVA